MTCRQTTVVTWTSMTINKQNCLYVNQFTGLSLRTGGHKTRTPRINGTKSMFMAYSIQGQLKPWLFLAEGSWDGLIQAAAYLGRESVRINALKRCPRLAEAVNDCCSWSVFNYIPDLYGREKRVAVEGKWVLFTFTKWKMADRDSCKKRNVWSAPEEKQILLICSELEIAGTSRWNHSTDRCQIFRRGFRIKFPNFLWPINYLGTQHQSWPKRQFKMKKTVKKTAFFTGQSQSFRFFARLRNRLRDANAVTAQWGTKTNYVIIEPVWPRTKPWTIYTSSSHLI